MVKNISAIACNVDVRQPIVVVVCDGNAHPPAFTRESRLFCNIRELKICVLMVKRNERVATLLAVALDARAIHRDDVQLAIVVAVDQAHPSAYRFNNVLCGWRRNVGDGQSRLITDVFELRNRDGNGTLLPHRISVLP